MIRYKLPALLLLAILAATPSAVAGSVAVQAAERALSARVWTDEEGEAHAPLASQGERATVLLFLMHDCPVTNSVTPELNRLSVEFSSRGVRFFRIYSTETAEELRKHTRDFGLTAPALLDPGMELASFTGATRAPEAVVLGPTGATLYRGRIDDRAVKAGVTRPVAHRRDLHLALQAVIAGEVPEPRFTPAVGCYLPVNASMNPAVQSASKLKSP